MCVSEFVCVFMYVSMFVCEWMYEHVNMWMCLCVQPCSFTSGKCDKWSHLYTHTHHTFECISVSVSKHVHDLDWICEHVHVSEIECEYMWVCLCVPECVNVCVFVYEWMCDHTDMQVNPWAYSCVFACHCASMSECVSMVMCESVNVDVYVC